MDGKLSGAQVQVGRTSRETLEVGPGERRKKWNCTYVICGEHDLIRSRYRSI
jgi:hypothetical protein